MKVKELIEKLSQLDPELMVVIRGYEGGVDEVSNYGLCNIWLNANDEWYYGRHETLSNNQLEEVKDRNLTIVKGVQLQ
jgi:hypothetical protein